MKKIELQPINAFWNQEEISYYLMICLNKSNSIRITPPKKWRGKDIDFIKVLEIINQMKLDAYERVAKKEAEAERFRQIGEGIRMACSYGDKLELDFF